MRRGISTGRRSVLERAEAGAYARMREETRFSLPEPAIEALFGNTEAPGWTRWRWSLS